VIAREEKKGEKKNHASKKKKKLHTTAVRMKFGILKLTYLVEEKRTKR